LEKARKEVYDQHRMTSAAASASQSDAGRCSQNDSKSSRQMALCRHGGVEQLPAGGCDCMEAA